MLYPIATSIKGKTTFPILKRISNFILTIMELIPGLPNDIARECLIRVTYDEFPAVSSTCKRWKLDIELPEFSRQRKLAGYSKTIVAMAQAKVDPKGNSGMLKLYAPLTYRITVCEPETGRWSELPLVPGGLPLFCQFAGVRSSLVVMGGWEPGTWDVSDSVFIYNFTTATWRRGANMPGGGRSFFGCASDGNRTVIVAGGHDKDKNAFKTAVMYDVAKDEWVQLPDMAKERDECKAIFHNGMFCVLGGYHTEMQGQFERTAESFDVTAWQWEEVEEDYLEDATCPRTCVAGTDRKVYMCREDKVKIREKSTWQTVAELPADVRRAAYMTTLEGKLLLVGSPSFGEPHMAYVLDLKGYTWKKVDVPEEYSGHVQTGYCLEV